MFTDEPLNAVGMRGWAPSEEPLKKEKKAIVVIRPEAQFKEQLPPSPREAVPHRSAGYGTHVIFISIEVYELYSGCCTAYWKTVQFPPVHA